MEHNVISDHSLARRLERTEALANARFVETRAKMEPGVGARWMEVAGAYAMYDGPHSPCTQTFGLGLFQMPTAEQMEILEIFFKDRRASIFHEVCPLADKALLPLLNQRGYRPVEMSQVMYQPLSERVPEADTPNEALEVRVVTGTERNLWAETAARGWGEFAEFASQFGDVMRVIAANEESVCFLAELDGKPLATGALSIQQGVALFAGAITVPEWRRRGAQRALLESRLQYAREAGCDLAMICAEPGSSSHRNSERQGFRTAYTRTKWGLAEPYQGSASSPVKDQAKS